VFTSSYPAQLDTELTLADGTTRDIGRVTFTVLWMLIKALTGPKSVIQAEVMVRRDYPDNSYLLTLFPQECTEL